MFSLGSQEPESDFQLQEDQLAPTLPTSCSQGHRSSLSLSTKQGGSICFLCFSNLVSDQRAPTIHISYALSQLSIAISQPIFLRSLLSSHSHFLPHALVSALSTFDDDPIAEQIVDLIYVLCNTGESSIQAEFVSRISSELASGALAWSRRQLYMLHCFGVLTNCQGIDLDANIKDKLSLVNNLVRGLTLPSEEIRGEILYVLQKLTCLLNGDGADILWTFCPKLLVLSLEALAKTQRDEVRLNCLALLTILAQQDLREILRSNDFSSMDLDGETHNFMRKSHIDGSTLHSLLAEAVKGPLLSTDRQVQISTLDLIFHYLSQEDFPVDGIHVLIEENIADYVFEILRLSECKDSVAHSCLRVLDIFSKAEQAFSKRLVIGFESIIRVLQHVAETPFHPFQAQTLKLILDCISYYPGAASTPNITEIVVVLSSMLRKYYSQEMELLTESFQNICFIFVNLLKTPSFSLASGIMALFQGSLRHAILASLSSLEKYPDQMLHSLYLLKEAYAYCDDIYSEGNPNSADLENCVLDVCRNHLLPWFDRATTEIHEEITAALMETFHYILLHNSHIQVREFADVMVSAAWFSASFGCLGYLYTENIKLRVYEMFGLLVDILLGDNKGHPIRDAAPNLPSDPVDLLFLLGQDSSDNFELSTCQSAVLLILHTSSLSNDRIADDKLVLESIEQYILLNGSRFACKHDSLETIYLLNLYGLYRGFQDKCYKYSYSPDAEQIIFHLLSCVEWSLHLANIHSVSLKWIFQQKRIYNASSYQILKFCQHNASYGNQTSVHGEKMKNSDIFRFAELVAAEDTHAAAALVGLLIEISEEHKQESNIILVLSLMKTAICFFDSASDQLYLHGIGKAIQAVCNSIYSSLQEVFASVLILIFNLLCSVRPGTLGCADSWMPVAVRLVERLIAKDYNWNHDDHFTIGIICLLLHHSTNGAFIEAAKHFVLNSALINIIYGLLGAACSKVPDLCKYDEGSSTVYSLNFALLLFYFLFKSLSAVLPPAVPQWQYFLSTSIETRPRSISDICANFSKLMQFGPPPSKLAASYCLLELFTIMSEEMDKFNELKPSLESLKSMMVLLEGLIFYEDTRVSMNCAFCLIKMLDWGDSGMPEVCVIAKYHNWCRLIAEEVSMSLAVSSLAANAFSNFYKPALYVTVALLRLPSRPKWMDIVFDDPCKSGIIRNITTTNITPEVVLLSRELLIAKFLNEEQIASLQKVFLACKMQMNTGDTWDELVQADMQNMAPPIDDVADAWEYLNNLMSSELSQNMSAGKSERQKKMLLHELDTFLRIASSAESLQGNEG